MNKEFQMVKLSEQGLNDMKKVALAFDVLLNEIKQYCPESRELSIAKTKLEEACFFAKKTIASNAAYQIGER